MSETTSKDLLLAYLLAGSVDELTSIEKFQKILPKDVDAKMAQFLYQEIKAQRRQRIEEVKKSISEKFDVPEVRIKQESIENDPERYDSTVFLQKINTHLTQLDSQLDQQIALSEADIDVELQDIEKIADSLQDLKFGKTHFKEYIEEATRELERLQERLLE